MLSVTRLNVMLSVTLLSVNGLNGIMLSAECQFGCMLFMLRVTSMNVVNEPKVGCHIVNKLEIS